MLMVSVSRYLLDRFSKYSPNVNGLKIIYFLHFLPRAKNFALKFSLHLVKNSGVILYSAHTTRRRNLLFK